MRDYAYTAPIYLIRTNYKTITKYFWIFCCLKKILISLMITMFYKNPTYSIVGVSAIQVFFLCFSIYCEPFERRYIRIHFYVMELIKLFLYVSLINFTEKYVSEARMIEMVKILYGMLTFMFGFNFFYILISIFVERDWYMRALSRKFCPNDEENKYL